MFSHKLIQLLALLVCIYVPAWTQCVASSTFEKLEQDYVSFLQFSKWQLELELRLQELETCRTATGCAHSSTISVTTTDIIPAKWPLNATWYEDGMIFIRISKEYPNSQIPERDIESFCHTTFDLESLQFDEVRTSKLNILIPEQLKKDRIFIQQLRDRLVLIIEIGINKFDSSGVLLGQEHLICSGSPTSTKKWFEVISRNHVGG